MNLYRQFSFFPPTKETDANSDSSPDADLTGPAGELIFLSVLTLFDWWVDFLDEVDGLGEEGSVMVRMNDLMVLVCDDPELGSPLK